jgi:hypothetical protein
MGDCSRRCILHLGWVSTYSLEPDLTSHFPGAILLPHNMTLLTLNSVNGYRHARVAVSARASLCTLTGAGMVGRLIRVRTLRIYF